MMGPDRNNYEIWLIDYIDGNLDKERKRILLDFLEQNPDIKEELGDLWSVPLIPGNLKFNNKQHLKKSPSELPGNQFELLCIASLENDLTGEQNIEFEEALITGTEKKRTFERYRKIKLSAPDLKYRYKYRLRKLTTGQKIFRWSFVSISSAAAIAILLVFSGRGPDNRSVTTSTNIAATNSSAYKPPAPHAANVFHQNPVIEGFSERSKNETPAVAVNPQPVPMISPDTLQIGPERIIIAQVSPIPFSYEGSKIEGRLAEMKIITVDTDYDPEVKGPGRFITGFFREKVLKLKDNRESRQDVYDIAGAGIKGLNRLLGWDMSLRKNRDAKGEITSVQFTSRLVKFTAPLKKGAS